MCIDKEQKRLGKFNLVLRPGRRYKFRFEDLPIVYEVDTVVQREFIFNGQRYNVGLPVLADAKFKIYRFGYEFDFVSKGLVYAGLLIDIKYSDVNVSLSSPPIGTEFTRAGALIPTIGGVGRGYVTRNVAFGGEMTFFRVPENLSETYGGKYTDYDFYGLVNFNRNTGATVGYKSIDAFYEVDNDSGALKFKVGLQRDGSVLVGTGKVRLKPDATPAPHQRHTSGTPALHRRYTGGTPAVHRRLRVRL